MISLPMVASGHRTGLPQSQSNMNNEWSEVCEREIQTVNSSELCEKRACERKIRTMNCSEAQK